MNISPDAPTGVFLGRVCGVWWHPREHALYSVDLPHFENKKNFQLDLKSRNDI